MGIRFKLLLAFLLSFVSIGVLSFYVLQSRLQRDFDALEQAEMKAALSQSTAVMEDMVNTLKSVTIDWAVWSDMYDFARQPQARSVWAEQNIGPDTVLNANLSFFEILGPQAQLIRATHSGKDGSAFSLDTKMREFLVQHLASGEKSESCFFLQLPMGDPSLLCASRITRSDESGNFVGIMAAVQVFSSQRMSDLRRKLGDPARWINVEDIAPQAKQMQSLDDRPDATMGKVAHWTQGDARLIYLSLPGMAGLTNLSLELHQSRTVHVHSQTLTRFVLAQSIATSFGASLVLTLAVHGFLILRLRSFHRQLIDISQGSGKIRRIELDGRDEIGVLAQEVNALLETIETKLNELTVQSLTDPLTGLSNRRAFDLRLALEFSRSRRDQQSLALLLMDVDLFKRYNDHYGHQQGDVALRTVARVLTSLTTRATDLAARIGGEEFAVLLPATSVQGALQVAQAVQQEVTAAALEHAASPIAPWLTVSIGIAMPEGTEDTPAALFALADRALYEAKTLGRNRIVVKGGSAMHHTTRPATDATDHRPSASTSAL